MVGLAAAQPQGAVETSAKLENQHSLEQRSGNTKTSFTLPIAIETPESLLTPRFDCRYAMRCI